MLIPLTFLGKIPILGVGNVFVVGIASRLCKIYFPFLLTKKISVLFGQSFALSGKVKTLLKWVMTLPHSPGQWNRSWIYLGKKYIFFPKCAFYSFFFFHSYNEYALDVIEARILQPWGGKHGNEGIHVKKSGLQRWKELRSLIVLLNHHSSCGMSNSMPFYCHCRRVFLNLYPVSFKIFLSSFGHSELLILWDLGDTDILFLRLSLWSLRSILRIGSDKGQDLCWEQAEQSLVLEISNLSLLKREACL